jgi:uncharacterized membrane protein YGL010W
MISQNSRLERYFNDYAQYHRTSGNRLTHLMGIPLIMISVLSWLSRVWIIRPEIWATQGSPLSLVRWDLGVATVIVVTIYYLLLNWRLALTFGLVIYGFYWLGRPLSHPMVWIFFIVGWVLQFYGHIHYEKRSPAFLTSVEHLLIGPFWIFAKSVQAIETTSPVPNDGA